MQKIHISDSSINAYYVRHQKDADAAVSRILNEINPKEEQIFADTETASLPEFRHEWGNKQVFYKPGLDPLKSYVRLLQIGFRRDVYVIDTHDVKDYSLVRILMQHPDIWKWFHNAKFDYKHLLWSLDVVTSNMVDFQAAAKLLNHPVQHLNFLAKHYLGRALNKEVRVQDWSVPELSEESLIYAADDVVVEIDLRDPIVKDLKSRNLWSAFSIECGALAPAGEMELNGSKVNLTKHAATMAWNDTRMRDLRTEIISDMEPYLPQLTLPGMLPDVNLKSNVQLLDILQRMGLDIEATNKKELRWKAADAPITAKVLELKRLDKLESSYNETILRAIHPVTKRIHSNFHGLFTTTLRFSSSDINLQNIRRCSCKGKVHDVQCCRDWFEAEDGFQYVTADYAAIEMVGAAVVANEQTLIDIFQRKLKLIEKKRRGEEVTEFEERMADPHWRTAAGIVQDVPILTAGKEDRQKAKPANFGLVYGMAWPKFRVYSFVEYGTMFSEEEAQGVHSRFFSTKGYGGLKQWHKTSKWMYKDLGIVTTMSGHQIPLTYNADYDSFSGPAALNYVVQNPCAAGNKRGMALTYKECRPYMNKAQRWTGPMLVRTVHDENSLEVPTRMAEDCVPMLENTMKDGMNKVFRRDDLVSVEATVGRTWASK